MKNVYFIEYKGKEILFIDFSNKSPEEELKVIAKARENIRQERDHKILILTDVTESKFNIAVSKALKELTKGDIPYVKKSAVVGIKGMRKILYEAVLKFTGRKDLKSFENFDEAKEWLIQD